MKEANLWILLLGIGQSTPTPQFRLNLGGLFGAIGNQNKPQNNDNRNNNNRLDLGQIAGGILGNVVGQALNNTDVQVGLGSGGNLQVAVVPKNPGSNNNNVNNGDDGESCSGNCDCWERGVDYAGGDLRIRNNPSQTTGAEQCQELCQKTSGCVNWAWERKRSGGSRRINQNTRRCWLKGSSFRKSNSFDRISGPRKCINIQITNPQPITSSSCLTVGGGKTGASCVFPFIYKGVKHNNCILIDADDGKPWCSTKTDQNGKHVGGQGQWGHCPASGCTGASENTDTVHVNVQGSNSISNTKLSQIPWLNNGDLPPAAAAAIGAASGVSQNDVNNRFFFGLNEPDVAHQTCRAPGGSQGSCRHIHHCVDPVYFNFFTFLTHMCIIQGRYLGVCCPSNVTPAPTPAPTQAPTPAPTPAPTAAPTAAPPAPTRSCGVNAKRHSTRIVGGRPADPDEWPWLAALVHKQGSGSGQYCGATLISDNHVITAAHCLKPFNKDDILIKLGEYDFNQNGETGDETFSVAAMKLHENYNDVTYENDIAIMRLNRPATFSDSIWPICLPEGNRELTNTRAYVIGWGTIYFGGPTSDTLQEVNVRVWDQNTCKNNYASLGKSVLDTMLCAGETNKDSCQGDSGGPLNCFNPLTNKWELCGVVSWGAKCAEPDFPGVYSRTTKYLDWIQQNQI